MTTRLITQTEVDTRSESATLASKVNIVPSGTGPNAPIRVEAITSAPGSNAVLADTGQLAAGTYRIEGRVAYQGSVAAGKEIAPVQHRDSGNSSTVASFGPTVAATDAGGSAAQGVIPATQRVLAANERVRVVGGATGGGAGSLAEVVLIVTRGG